MELWSEYRDDIHESHEAIAKGYSQTAGATIAIFLVRYR